MIACSLDPEGIIAMDFNSPKEVEEFLATHPPKSKHWVLYGVDKNGELKKVYEYLEVEP